MVLLVLLQFCRLINRAFLVQAFFLTINQSLNTWLLIDSSIKRGLERAVQSPLDGQHELLVNLLTLCILISPTVLSKGCFLARQK